MISSGLFVLPGLVAAQVGDAVTLVYLFSGVLLLPSMLSIAELATAMPRAGGTYFFISRSLGSMFGTVAGIGDWLALLLKTGIALIGLGAYLSGHLDLPLQIIALLFCIFFVVLNLFGAKETSGLQLIMVLILLAILAYFISAGISSAPVLKSRSFFGAGFESFLPATAMVFISYIGLTKVASIAEEIKRPERNIPLGMLLSLGVVLVFYCLVILIVSGIVPAGQLYKSLTPVSDAVLIFGGSLGLYLVEIAALMAFATTANAGILSASRYLLAMSRDRVIPHS
ncbi:amino acid permease, partial [candidate division KSB1 bacterium]|nr:amino acid permease [candidate division KSB1 bacterium]